MKARNILIRLLISAFWCITAIPAFSETSLRNDAKRVMVVPIEGMIDEVQDAYIKRAVGQAIMDKMDYVLFEIETYGGRVDSAQEICVTINSLEQHNIPAVVFIPERAISAGAMITLSSEMIYMSPAAQVGDAKPVVGGEATDEEKYLSMVRTELKAQAEHNGHNPAIAQAFADQSLELYAVEIDGVLQVYEREEYYGVRDRMKQQGVDLEIKKTVNKEGNLLSLTGREAVEYGFAEGVANNRDEVYRLLGIEAAETRLAMSWSEVFAQWLVSPIVTSLLFTIGLIALFSSLKVPGTGLPEGLAVLCFAALFFGKYISGLATIFDILLFVAGFILMLLEIFVFPGFGVAGIAGIICLVLGMLFSLQSFEFPDNPMEVALFERNLSILGATFLCTIVGIALVIRFLPKAPIVAGLFNQDGVPATQAEIAPHLASLLVGQAGTAHSDLRPAGKVLIGEQLVDAVTQGDFIQRDQPVRVVQIEGARVVVKSDAKPV